MQIAGCGVNLVGFTARKLGDGQILSMARIILRMSEEENNELNPDVDIGPPPNAGCVTHAIVPAPNLPAITGDEMEQGLRQLGASKTEIKHVNAKRLLGSGMQKAGVFQYAVGELIHTNIIREDMIRKCRTKLRQKELTAEDFGIYAHSLNAALNGRDKNTAQLLSIVEKPDWQDPKPQRPQGAPPKKQPIVVINTTGNVACKEEEG